MLEHRTRGQRWAAAVVAGAFVAWKAARGLARIMLDRCWLDSVTDAPLWARRTAAQLQLGLGAAILVLIVLGTSVCSDASS